VNGICGCDLPAYCCQPAVAGGVIYAYLWGELSTHLDLQALFTQSSPVLGKVTLHPHSQACMFAYSSRGKWVFPPTSCGVFLLLPLSQAFPLLITGQCCCSCQLQCLFTVHVGSGSCLLSCVVFLPPPLSHAFPLLVAGCAPPLLPEPLQPGPACLFTVLGRIPFPQSLALRVPHPLSCVSLLFLLLITQFLFFPGWRSVCPGGYAALGQACLWEYRGTAKLTLSTSSQAVWAWASDGLGALWFCLVSCLTNFPTTLSLSPKQLGVPPYLALLLYLLNPLVFVRFLLLLKRLSFLQCMFLAPF
jgi:hypothetical protein